MKKNRYVVLAVAALVNFVHGNPYIWTVFQPHVRAEYGLDAAASSQPFTIIIGVFALGNMLGGLLQHKIGPRLTVFFGSALMCGGFLMAAFAPTEMPWVISAGYGFFGGMGSGCAFSVLVAVPQEWFPDKRGLVTGITVGVVGISGIIMNPFCDFLLGRYGYRTSMLTVTGIYALLSFAGAWFIDSPEGGQKIQDVGIAHPEGKQYKTREIFRTKTYYLLSLSMALGVPAYVLVNPLMKSLGMQRGLTDEAALLGVVIASGANIAGRFLAPYLSDRLGPKKVVLILYGTAAVSVAGIAFAQGGLFIAMISGVSFTYGGFVGVYPVWTAGLFGIKYQAMNFGAVMLLYGVASVLCPYLMKAAESTRYGLNLSFLTAGIICAFGIAATCCLKGNPK